MKCHSDNNSQHLDRRQRRIQTPHTPAAHSPALLPCQNLQRAFSKMHLTSSRISMKGVLLRDFIVYQGLYKHISHSRICLCNRPHSTPPTTAHMAAMTQRQTSIPPLQNFPSIPKPRAWYQTPRRPLREVSRLCVSDMFDKCVCQRRRVVFEHDRGLVHLQNLRSRR